MRARAGLAALIVLLGAVAARAGTGTGGAQAQIGANAAQARSLAADAPYQARLRAAEGYCDASGYASEVEVFIDVSVARYAQFVAQRGGKADADTETQVSTLIRPDFASLAQAKRRQMIDLLVAHFTTDELQALTRQFQTPLGRKVLAARPGMLRAMYADSHADMQPVILRVWTTHLAAFEKLGLAFPKAQQQ